MVTGKAEAVFQTEGSGPEQVCLHGNTVAVPAGHLHDRLQAFPQGYGSRRYAGYADNRGLAVRNVRRVTITLQKLGLFDYLVPISAHGRAELSRDRRLSAGKDFFECAFALHYFLPPAVWDFCASCSSYCLICSTDTRRGPPSRDVDQLRGGWISASFSMVPSFFILSTIRYQTQSTSWLTSHLPLFVPPQGPFMSVLEQRAMGQRPPVRCTMQSPQPAHSSLKNPGASTAP